MRGTSGVMARDMSVLLASCKALMSAEQFEIDSGIPPMTFNQQVCQDKTSSLCSSTGQYCAVCHLVTGCMVSHIISGSLLLKCLLY